MAKAKHATGPWEIGQEYANSMDEIVCPDGRSVAVVWTRRCNETTHVRECYKPCPEGQANARLIAAAPELYSALQLMLEKFQDDVRPGEAGWDAIEAARSAIFKAEGK